MKINDFAKPIFAGKQYGLANQFLNIAIIETEKGEDLASHYFTEDSNFELTIKLTQNFNE